MADTPEEVAARFIASCESFWTWELLPTLPDGYRVCRVLDDTGFVRYGYEYIASHPIPHA